MVLQGQHKDKKPKPEKPPKPPKTTTTPAPDTTYVLGSFGNLSIDQWANAFIAASDAVFQKRGVRVDPRFLAAMMEVESGGNGNYPASKCRSDGSCGPMQIKFSYHQYRCPGCDLFTVPGQIELAGHIIGMVMLLDGVDEYGALLAVYFPTDDVINGTTQAQYKYKVKRLVAQMEADAGGAAATSPTTQTTAPPAHVTPAQVISLITGGVPLNGPIFGFNERNPGQHLYQYGVNHGTSGDEMHTGNDLPVPLGTVLHTPLAGIVRCVGNQGSGDWGQGCGSFNDTITGGVGNVTVLSDVGLKLTFGHVNKPLVAVGQRVIAGQPVATSGGMFSPHLHLDAVVNRNGYWLLDPLPAIAEAMGGHVPAVYPQRLPVPQPDDDPPYWIVRVTALSVKVLQFGGPESPEVAPPLKQGETFNATYQLPGLDGKGYWVSTRLGRVPINGTEMVKVVLP